MNIRLCLDNTPFNSKPNDIITAFISKKIAGNELTININELAEIVGNRGCTFTPVTFHNQKRTNHNFKSQQIFALDFDGGVSFEEISNRAIEYNYISSTECYVFIYNISVVPNINITMNILNLQYCVLINIIL